MPSSSARVNPRTVRGRTAGAPGQGHRVDRHVAPAHPTSRTQPQRGRMSRWPTWCLRLHPSSISGSSLGSYISSALVDVVRGLDELANDRFGSVWRHDLGAPGLGRGGRGSGGDSAPLGGLTGGSVGQGRALEGRETTPGRAPGRASRRCPRLRRSPPCACCEGAGFARWVYSAPGSMLNSQSPPAMSKR